MKDEEELAMVLGGTENAPQPDSRAQKVHQKPSLGVLKMPQNLLWGRREYMQARDPVPFYDPVIITTKVLLLLQLLLIIMIQITK